MWGRGVIASACAVLLLLPPATPVSAAAAGSCENGNVYFVGAHGLNEGPDYSSTIAATMMSYSRWAAEHGHSNKTSFRWVTYPNVSTGELFSSLADTVEIAVAVSDALVQAVGNLTTVIENIRKECDSARIVLAGYSFGAMTIGIYLATHRPDMASMPGVMLYGDPLWFDKAQGDRGLARLVRDFTIMIVQHFDVLFDDEAPYPYHPDRVGSICYAKDPVCGTGFHSNAVDQLSQGGEQATCGTSGSGPHMCYADHAAGRGGVFLAERALGGI